MRAISQALSNLQQESGRTFTYEVLKDEWFWKFSQQTSPQSSMGLVDAEIPQSFSWDGSVYRFWGHDSSTGYSSIYTLTEAGILTNTGILSSNASIRGNFYGNNLYYADGNPYTIRKLGSPVSLLTGIPFTNTPTLVRRVEAVVPVLEGQDVLSSTFIVAVGVHDFTEKLSNIAYFLLSNGTTTRLRTITQLPLDTPYTNWYGFQKKAANFHAIAMATGEYLCAAQDTTTGRVVTWTLKNGVESYINTVIPIDHDLADIDFILSGLYKIGGLYYMTGMFARNMTDGTVVKYNCYLRSLNGKDWSIGERAHYINNEQSVGCFSSSYSGGTIRWMGHGKTYTAPALTSGVDITNNLVSFDISQKLTEGDSFEAQFDTEIPVSSILTVKIGYSDSSGISHTAQIGKFAVDSCRFAMQSSGRSVYEINARDLATAMLSSKSPLDIQRESTVSVDSSIVNFDGLIAKLFAEESVAKTSPLVHSGLNAPSIFYDGARSNADGIVRATVKFESVTAFCQQSVGLVFGMNDTKFNVVVFPRTSTWAKAIADVSFRKSKLESWSQDNGMLPLISGATSEYSVPGTLTKFSSSPIAQTSGVYYDLAVRTHGDRLQLFIKLHDENLATQAANSTWTYLAEYRLSSQERKAWSDSSYCGITLSTDVTSSREWFAQSAYGDLSVQLTEAYERSDFNTSAYGTSTFFNRLVNTPPGTDWQGYSWQGQYVIVNNDIGKFVGLSGLAVRIVGFQDSNSSKHDQFGYVYDIDVPNKRIRLTQDGKTIYAAPYSSMHCTLYVLGSKSDTHATVGSGYKVDTVFNVPVTTGNTVVKFPDSVSGRALFTTDGTVFAPRYVETDSITTFLRSGSPASLIGFEHTTPVHMTWDAESGTWNSWDVRSWRMILNHGLFFKGAASDQGLPADGLFKVDDELIKYKEVSFPRSGVYPNLGDTDAPVKWCVIPTLYSSLSAAPENSQNLTTWINGDGQYVGDDLSNTAGYLAEIISKDSSGLTSIYEDATQYHVSSSTAHSIQLDVPYPNSIIGASPGKGDILVLSGRGWDGTRKTSHSYDSVVKYYPSLTKKDGFLYLKHFSSARGLFNSSTTDLISTMALFGVFDVQHGILGSLTSIGISQSLIAPSVADFECVYRGHVYSDKTISFNFRNYYQLDIWGSYSDGRSKITLELHAPNDGGIINPSPKRYLEAISVDISDLDTFSSSSIQHELRLIVKNDFIQVEFQGQLIWRFHLSEHNTQSKLAGGVYVSASSPISGIYVYVPEMSDEMESHIVDMGMSGREALGYIIQERYLRTKITEGGGLFVGRFLTRSTLPYTLGDLIISDDFEASGSNVAGHARVSGAEIGETLDDSWTRENGYYFDVGQNRLANTVTESAAIAKTLVVYGIEESVSNPINTHFHADIEVGDKLPVYYANAGDIYSRPQLVNALVSEINISGTQTSLSAIYLCRKSYV